MKGLVLKDCYMAMKYCRWIFVFMIFCLAASALDVNSSFFMAYSTLMASMIPVTLISYDEKNGWNTYSEVFPWSRKQIVSSKYLMALILTGSMWLLTILTQMIRMMRDPSIRWEELMALLSILLAMGLVGTSVMLPIIFKFGSEKGRLAYLVVIVMVCASAAGFSTAGIQIGEYCPEFLIRYLPAVVLVAAVCIFIGSWLLSVKFYREKEL